MSATRTLGKHEIRRQLGRGAMGTVYEGWDPVIERLVAVKTVRLPSAADDQTANEIARFRREAQAAGRLNHPNIVSVFDYGETEEVAYIVMEYVDGPTLKTLLDRRESFPLPRVLAIMEDLLAGLQFSHERGVVHRDIKPANVMLTTAGQAKIADFGIARLESSSMTRTGTVLGTPAYMSPEQFMGQIADARSDIYSSGVLLYQLLTGERPFEGSITSIMHKALYTEATPPSRISVTVPRRFDAVIERAMAKRPEDRYASAKEFAAAIRAAAVTPAPAPAEPRQPVSEMTVVAGAGSGRLPSGRLPSGAAVAGRVAPMADPSPRAVKPRTIIAAPGFIGAGAIGLAALGIAGYFLLSGPSTPPAPARETAAASVTPPSSSVATLPAAEPTKAVALAEPVVPPASGQPANTPTPAVAPAAPPPAAAPAATEIRPVVAPAPPPAAPPPAASPAATEKTPPVIALAPQAAAPETTPVPPPLPTPTTSGVAPPVEVAPPVSAPPQSMPLPPQPAPSPLEQLREAARSVPCSALRVAGDADGPRISGFAHSGPTLARLLGQAGAIGPLNDDITLTERSTCAPLEAVAASALRTWDGGPAIAIKYDRRDPTSGTRFRLGADTKLPLLYIDLYQNDGQVRHLLRPASGAEKSPHLASVTAPAAGPGLIVAIGTSRPLQPDTAPDTEPAVDYLAALRPQLEQATAPLAVALAMIMVRPAETVVTKPVAPPVPRPRPGESAVAKEPMTRPPALRSARCSNIVSRAELGETLSNAELTALRTECRS